MSLVFVHGEWFQYRRVGGELRIYRYAGSVEDEDLWSAVDPTDLPRRTRKRIHQLFHHSERIARKGDD